MLDCYALSCTSGWWLERHRVPGPEALLSDACCDQETQKITSIWPRDTWISTGTSVRVDLASLDANFTSL